MFISYSSADEELRQELETHLALLKREEAVETWTFRSIDAGADWKSEIDARLDSSDLIILLVSASFVASDYCWNIEMRRALQRHRDGNARVIPIIVRECDWSSAPFAGIQALPPSAKPVTSWRPRDKAWTAVVDGLRKVIQQPLIPNTPESPIARSETAVQRAQRLAAESRARKAHEEKWRSQGHGAFVSETEIVFQTLESQAKEIRETTDVQLEAGWRHDHGIVRLRPLRQNMYPLTLHLGPYFNGTEREESHLNVRLLFGGMVLPQETGQYYLEQPKEHVKRRYPFRLTPDGRWVWVDPSTKSELTSQGLATSLLNDLLQMHDDVETGRVKQPSFY
jgi:TIR domain